jgi:hypothetical protein
MDAKVNDPCGAYLDMEPDWALCNALMGGTRAMRAAGEKYLPRFAAETQEAYDKRLARTVLTNYFRETLDKLTAKPFSKPIILGDDVPEEIAGKRGRSGEAGKGGWVENIDLAGNHLDVFAREVFRAGWRDGVTHILVDSTGTGQTITRHEERSVGVRPYLVHILAANVLGWRHEIIGGKPVLTQVRIREVTTEPLGEFGETTVTRVRVLTPGAYYVYEEDKDGNWFVRDDLSGVTSLPYIPLVTFYGGKTGFMCGRSPLIDLAHLNVAHWQSSSDQRNILTTSRFAMLAASGYNKDLDGEVVVGPNRVLTTSDPNGKWYYVEPAGAAIAAGRQDLKDLQEDMAMVGLQMMLPRTGSVTATGRALDAAENNSTVQALASGLADCLEQALQIMADWAGLEGGGSVSVNKDFGLSLQQAQDAANLIALRNSGDISRATLWAELKRRGLLADDFDPEAETSRLEDEFGQPTGQGMEL